MHDVKLSKKPRRQVERIL